MASKKIPKILDHAHPKIGISVEEFKMLKEMGLECFIARGLRSIGIEDDVGIQNLKNALEG